MLGTHPCPIVASAFHAALPIHPVPGLSSEWQPNQSVSHPLVASY